MGIATSAAFTAAVVSLMAPRQVRFLNVRAANLPDLRSAAYPGEAHATSNSPFLFFAEKEVVLGTVASVVAPRPGEGVIIAPREGWKETLLADARLKAVIPGASKEQVFVIGFDDRRDDAGDLALVREAASFAHAAGVAADLASGNAIGANAEGANAEGANARRGKPTMVFARVPSAPGPEAAKPDTRAGSSR